MSGQIWPRAAVDAEWRCPCGQANDPESTERMEKVIKGSVRRARWSGYRGQLSTRKRQCTCFHL